MQLSHEGQSYILTLCLRSDLPQPDHWHFNWHEFLDVQPSPLELFLVFGDGCLLLTTGNNNLATFILPQRLSTPGPLTNNGWTLSPATGAYFFARSSVSVGHLFPSTPALDFPRYRFPRPKVVLWPNQTPAIFSHPLPPTTLAAARPPSQDIPNAAAVLSILQCPTLNPFDWMVAYAALTLPHFCADHIPVLQNPQVLTFDAKIRQPLISGQTDVVAAYLTVSPLSEGTFSVVPQMLVSSSMSIKCPRTTSPSWCTPLITVTALTLSLYHRNISFRHLLSLPLVYNKLGLPPAPL